MLMIPEPMWICSVRAATYGMSTSLAEMWEYSPRKWCSVNHEYFQLVRSPTSHEPHLAHEALVLGRRRVEIPQVLGDEAPAEQSELHRARLEHVLAPSAHRRPTHLRMLTARAMTSATVASETADCSIIVSLAQRLNGMVSVGLKAAALVNDT